MEIECDYCGNTIERPEYSVKRNEHNFCNRKCRAEWRKEQSRVEVICEWCEDSFERIKSHLRGGHNFCSIKCKAKWQKKYLKGEENPKWRGGRVTKVCEVCGEEYKVKPANAEVSRFCSRKCQGVDKRTSLKGKNNVSWKEKVIKICPICKKEFKVFPANADRRVCCSRTCMGKLQWKKRVDRDDAFGNAPTGIEKQMMRIVSENCIPLKYVGDGKRWIHTGEYYINPDFINDDIKAALEVFGSFWHDSNNKYIDEKYTEENRSSDIASAGYTPIIVWDEDLNNPSDVVNKVNNILDSLEG